MEIQNQKRYFFLFTAIVFFLLSLPVMFDIHLPLISSFELKSIDYRFRWRGVRKPSGNVVIVSIDDKSLEAVGRWPWPRFVLAELIRLLNEAGTTAIGVDLLLSEPEQNPELTRIKELIHSYTQLGLLNDASANQAFFDELIQKAEHADNDGYLAGIMKETENIVNAMAFLPTGNVSGKVTEQLLRFDTEHAGKNSVPENIDPVSLPGLIFPILSIAGSSSEIGFVNIDPDLDGRVRKGIGIIKHKDHFFSSLPIQTSLVYKKKSGKREFHYPPLDASGRFFIGFYGPDHTIPHYSAVDILTGKVDRKALQGKCVFIGGAAVGLGDHWSNPFSAKFWGVELQATIADNCISGKFYYRPGWIKYIDLALMFLAGSMITFVTIRLPLLWHPPMILIFCTGSIILNQIVFSRYAHILTIIPLLLLIITVGTGVFLLRYIYEGRQNRFLKKTLYQYVSPSVIHAIMKNPGSLSLGGDKRNLSVLFCDIRGFTSISETLEPDMLVKLINDYLNMMTNIVMENQGTLDKYIGDAVMAIYGAPVEFPDHANLACKSALQMIEALQKEQTTWSEKGYPNILSGIGINTGKMVVGNMGSEKRFDYTVIGDNVNLSSRLEGLTKMYGVSILVSGSTVEKAGSGFSFREIDLVRVKGKSHPVKIYELLGEDLWTHGKYEFIPVFSEALEAYRNKKWDLAIRHFQETIRLKQKDGPSTIFIDRCNHLKQTPPPDDWGGVYTMHQK